MALRTFVHNTHAHRFTPSDADVVEAGLVSESCGRGGAAVRGPQQAD